MIKHLVSIALILGSRLMMTMRLPPPISLKTWHLFKMFNLIKKGSNGYWSYTKQTNILERFSGGRKGCVYVSNSHILMAIIGLNKMHSVAGLILHQFYTNLLVYNQSRFALVDA